MSSKRDQFDVFQEPHHKAEVAPPLVDPSETVRGSEIRTDDDRQRVDHSVWDEPTHALAGGETPDGLSFSELYERSRKAVTPWKSWTVSLGVALAAGPLAVLAVFLAPSGETMVGLILLIVLAPTIEEVVKLLAPTILVEKAPWLVTARSQIIAIGVCSGLAFAAIENALYLLVYIPDPTPLIVWWRWTVCVALHVTCTTVGAIGLAMIWRTADETNSRPNLQSHTRWLVAAIVIHGAYNALAYALEFTGIFESSPP
ncbi:MAG: PrsW family glutamic-type intramembrane protease [Planctomycetota bacterium]